MRRPRYSSNLLCFFVSFFVMIATVHGFFATRLGHRTSLPTRQEQQLLSRYCKSGSTTTTITTVKTFMTRLEEESNNNSNNEEVKSDGNDDEDDEEEPMFVADFRGRPAGVVIEDLNWRVEKLRLEEANTRRFLKAGPRFLPYEECRKWVQAWGNRWSSSKEWENWIAAGEKRNSYIPSRPEEYYSRTGDWISWDHFLGVDSSEAQEDSDGEFC